MDRIIGLVQRNVWLLPLSLLIILLVGFLFGLVTGWFTVDYRPNADDVVAAADALSINNDPTLAKRLLANLSKDEAAQLLGSLIAARTSAGKTAEADRLRNLANAINVVPKVVGAGTPAASGTPIATRAPSGASTSPTSDNTWLTLLLGLLALGVLLALGYYLLTRFRPNLGQRRARPERSPIAQRIAETPIDEPVGSQVIEVDSPTSMPAVSRVRTGNVYQASYSLGHDSYEASYSLDTPKGEVLGECGMGISELIGEGKPEKVTAFDIWLFERQDVRTLNQVIMSEYAYQDQALRTRLLTKGELILAEKGKRLHLETHSFRMDGKILEVVYETNPSLPPNSYFKKLVVEIIPTFKDSAVAR